MQTRRTQRTIIAICLRYHMGVARISKWVPKGVKLVLAIGYAIADGHCINKQREKLVTLFPVH